MKRIVVSVGLVALGAASVYAQAASPAPKWWSASATLRGFYDDNLNTTPDGGDRIHTFGYQVSPTVGLSAGNEQTSFSANYRYSYLYYEIRPPGNIDKNDQDHEFDLLLNHAFNERYKLRIGDRFVIGQQPDALRTGNFITQPYRVSGDNIANSGNITFNAELTPVFGVELGYDNSLYDYADSFSANGFVFATTSAPNVATNGAILPSNSGTLDRIEQNIHIDGRWTVLPDTRAILGYKYGMVDYTADEPIFGNFILPKSTWAFSDVRNNRSHTGYVGVEHEFNPEFVAAAKVGASYYDYYNDPTTTGSFGPYANAMLSYIYNPDSYIRAGFQESRIATDFVGTSGDFVHDQEASVFFLTIRHRIVPNLFGELNGTFQNGVIHGGGSAFDGKTEQFYQFGASLEYQINPHFSTHVGYDYDQLNSDLASRDYHRNKVYMGVTASY